MNNEETQPITKHEFSRMQENITRLLRAVFGNGEKIGMGEDLRTLRRDFDIFTKEERERRKIQENERRFYVRAVVVMLITNMLSLLGYAIYWFIRFAPLIEASNK